MKLPPCTHDAAMIGVLVVEGDPTSIGEQRTLKEKYGELGRLDWPSGTLKPVLQLVLLEENRGGEGGQGVDVVLDPAQALLVLAGHREDALDPRGRLASPL